MRFFYFLVFIPVFGSAQKQTTQVQQTWLGYFNQSRLSDKWGLWFDGHLRTKEDFVHDLSQGIARAGVTYYFNDNTRLTAGYAYVHYFPADNHKNIAQPEHRPWQLIQWQYRFPKFRLTQGLRLEQRFRHKIMNDNNLADGYNFNWRIRHNIQVSLPLAKKAFAANTVTLVANDEIHINFGKEIIYNYFDQNRIFLGFIYHVSNHDNIQFGYMNQFQQLPSGNRYRSNHVIRLFYFQNLDFRSNSKK